MGNGGKKLGFGILWTFDGERFHATGLHGVPTPYEDFLRSPAAIAAAAALPDLIRGKDFVHVADLAASETYRTGDRLRRATVDLGGARPGLAVPVRKDDAVLGIFVIHREEVRPFTDKQIALLENFAAQAVARRSGWEGSDNQDENLASRHRHDYRGLIVAQVIC